MDLNSPTTHLKTLYTECDDKRATIAIKVLKKLYSTSYIIADCTLHFNLKIREGCNNDRMSKLLMKNKYLKISNVAVNRRDKQVIVDEDTKVEECDPISGIACEVCKFCDDVVYDEKELFEHFEMFKSCKKKHEDGNGQLTTVVKFCEGRDQDCTLKLKILQELDTDIYEAADHTGICRFKIDQDHPQRKLVAVNKQIYMTHQKLFSSRKKFLYVGKLCFIEETSKIKIPVSKYNEDLPNAPKVSFIVLD